MSVVCVGLLGLLVAGCGGTPKPVKLSVDPKADLMMGALMKSLSPGLLAASAATAYRAQHVVWPSDVAVLKQFAQTQQMELESLDSLSFSEGEGGKLILQFELKLSEASQASSRYRAKMILEAPERYGKRYRTDGQLKVQAPVEFLEGLPNPSGEFEVILYLKPGRWPPDKIELHPTKTAD